MTADTGNGRDRSRWPASPHDATRFILDHLPGSVPLEGAPNDVERVGRLDDPATLASPNLIDDSHFSAIHVADPKSVRGESGFAAFLDGTQQVRRIGHSGGIPILWATVSAGVRVRIDRRMSTWRARRPIVKGRFYIPFRYLENLPDVLRNNPDVVDTGEPASTGEAPSRHPDSLIENALRRIQRDREEAEREMAEAWCAAESSVLFVDGSVAASPVASKSALVVGVIKTHRRLYAEGDAFDVVVALPAGSRTSVFQISSRSRQTVASWYLRTRSASGRDAMFGLVRVEAALTPDIGARANEISSWIIAEGAPLALPDGRWDKMTYGIRDTEEFLRAIS